MSTTVLLARQRAVYVEVPKVACSSIKLVLAGVLGIDLEPAGGNPHAVEFPAAPPANAGPVLYPGLFSFAFVRSPWDRLVSCYRDKILGEAPEFTEFHPTRGVAYCLAGFDAFRAEMSFDEFVDAVVSVPDVEADDHFRSQHTFVTNAAGEIGVDFVGRFERLTVDFAAVARRVGLPATTLPRAQAVRTPRRYADYYTPRTRLAVEERFRRDIELFGYEFG